MIKYVNNTQKVVKPVRKRSREPQALILETALILFTEKGYFNTSVHDIQKKANVSIGSIYHYFKNKEAIAKAIYDDLVERMEQIIIRIRSHHHTIHDRCRAIIEYLLEMADQTPGKMQYLLYSIHQEFMPQEKSVCSSKPFEMIREMIKEGIDNDEIRKIHPAVASACLLGGTIRLIRLHLDGVLDQPLLSYLDEIWTCSWNSVAK